MGLPGVAIYPRILARGDGDEPGIPARVVSQAGATLMRWIVGTLLIVLLILGLSVRQHWVEVPERWNPWAPLRFDAPPDLFTRWRLDRLSQDAPACARFLATTPLRYETLTDLATGEGCGLNDAVRIDALPAAVGTPFSLSCRTAASLALWQRHVLEPAAHAHLASAVVRVEHFGSYSCRNVYNRPAATRSRHATAEAFDLAGFVLEDGRRIRVLRDWSGDGPESRFLHEIRAGACRYFDGVLSPDYNAAHRDHLHLDRGPFRLCR